MIHHVTHANLVARPPSSFSEVVGLDIRSTLPGQDFPISRVEAGLSLGIVLEKFLDVS